MATVPPDGLLRWFNERNANLFHPTRADLYALCGEELLAARSLLQSNTAQARRRGLRLATLCNVRIASELKDASLRWLVCRGWTLPFLDSAPEERGSDQSLSREDLLCDALAACEQIKGEQSKQIDLLRTLLNLTNDKAETQRAGWARLKLANLLAARGQTDAAIDLAQKVNLPNLGGVRASRERWHKERNLKATSTQAPPKNEASPQPQQARGAVSPQAKPSQ